MRAISIVPVNPVGGSMSHRGAALRAPISPPRHHAPRGLRYIR
jgi:hypothetical protein